MAALKQLLSELADSKASIQRALQAEQTRHVDLVDRVPWLVVRFDSELRYVDANRAFRSLFPGEDVLARHLGECGEGEHWVRAIEAFHVGETTRSEEVEIELDVDGRRRRFVLGLSRGELDGHVSVVGMDHTDRIEALVAAEEAARRADAANRAKSEFLAIMSHEIRTPLSGVVGVVELLGSTRLDEDQQSYVRTLQSSGATLRRLVDDVLDLSKIEAGKLELEHTDFELRDAVERAAQLFIPQAQEKALVLDIELDAALPERVMGDDSRLRQVLMNLTGNAIKFTERGGVTVRAAVVGAGAERRVRFEVADTGVGMSVEQAAKVRSAFVQADSSTTRRFGGTGLGLTISQRLIERMGGELTIESEVGRGTRVWFEVAFESVAAPALDDASAAQEAERCIAQASPLVLVAEDNPVNQRLARAFLKKLGCCAVVVGDGRQAVDALIGADRPFDLVLMDIDMPVLDGRQATAAIRALTGDRRHTPIVAMTANAVVGDREACLASGMQAWLGKPCTLSEMAITVAEVLGLTERSRRRAG